ncbi:MAG: AEC family transporter [Armatimonadota bacterium]|nr:AEC family transporter [Armatimonadota bacterium]MDW8105445.1 AEC family transporter [Armatimonadota bacterium]MDW8290856.1 AEC family transporter [Armatimonadota bacterium]
MKPFGVLLSLFLVLFMGYLLKRRGILHPSDSSVMNRLILDVTLPAFVFHALYRQRVTEDMVHAAWLFAGLQVAVMALLWLPARLLRLPPPVMGTLLLTAVFGNTGFLGYPVVQAIFGKTEGAMAAAVVYDQFSVALTVYTVGIAVAMHYGSRYESHWRELLGFFRTPTFIVLLLTLLVNTLRLSVPPFLTYAAQLVAGATVPLVLLSLGLMLEPARLRRNHYYLPMAIILLVKMALFPYLMWLATGWAEVGGVARLVAVTQSAMPSAMVNAVITERYGCDHQLATLVIVVGTLLTLGVLPVTMTLLGVG